MITIQRILCPVDFSEHSRRALDHAVALAHWYKASVTVLYVFAPTALDTYNTSPALVEPLLVEQVDKDRLVADVTAFATREAGRDVPLDVQVVMGRPATSIVEEARRLRADLIVLGTHGRSGFERLVLGSVTERVLRSAACPVLTVPVAAPDAVPVAAGLYTAVLCAIDFSASSMRALKFAVKVASEADAHLTVHHVVSHEFGDEQDPVRLTDDHGEVTIADFRRGRDDEIRRRMAAAIPAGAGDYCRIEAVLTHGKPWRELVRIANERHADLIVMGVQGRTVADTAFFGSTAHQVVRHAACPVLTLRS